MSAIINPCKDCVTRSLGCHAKCAKYKIFKALKERDNDKKKKYDEEHRCHIGMVIK